MKHTMRGVITAWLSLIVLETVVKSGSGRVSGALGDLASLVSRAFDPSIPAIPDRRNGSTSAPLPSEVGGAVSSPFQAGLVAAASPWAVVAPPARIPSTPGHR